MLGAAAESGNFSRPLPELGVDSLMAQELRKTLVGQLGVDLSLGDFLASQGLSAITHRLVAALEASADETPATHPVRKTDREEVTVAWEEGEL